MKALIVGLGSIGQRHVANLRALRPDMHITALRRTVSPPGAGIDRVVSSWDDALEQSPSIVLITSPAALHIEQAARAVQAGADLFIEKPLADRVDGIASLVSLVSENARIALVGYQFRFYPPLQRVRQALSDGLIGELLSLRAEVGMYLPDWRPGSDYRDSVSAQKKLGGGALLELSHELDLARWLMGEVSEVCAMAGRATGLEIDVEDIAEILLRFESGAMGSVHVDMAQRVPFRGLRIVGTMGTITWDWQTHSAMVWTAQTQAWAALWDEPVDRNLMYVDELGHFLDCVEQRTAPLVSIEDGEAVLKIALAARQSAAEHTWVHL